ncbi:MAG TPA: hypothetical protein VIB39_04225 [Candidatus Angelobacter sp.]
MSDPTLGSYHFLSWARRGIGASYKQPDNNGPLPDRATLNVQVSVTAQQGSTATVDNSTKRSVELFGPGDIIGLDPRHIIRTEPRNFTVNFEPNYLCGIEFDSPDLPWLFTPAAHNGDRLRPWLALIALKPDEFTLPSIAPNPLPVVNILTMAPLKFDLGDSWNWAHVQVSGDQSLSDAMSSAPGNVISRLLCPRRLDPETHYTVFLVPAFDLGVKAGLGQDVSAIHVANPAWTAQTTAPLTMPYYYQFEFNTSDEGDFESLVRRLNPRDFQVSDNVGIQPMDVSVPAPDVPSAGPPLGLQGALQSVVTQATQWNDPDKTNFQSEVQAFINNADVPVLDLDNPGDDPIIAPPIYGRWHAAVQSVDRTAAGWVNDLNLDPRNRSAGGMGTQVVQIERAQLMASAWQQVDGIRQANEVLHQAQLARAALQQIFRNRLQPTQPETMMTLTAPLHAKLMASPRTILATVRSTRVPERMLSGTFRRVTRPRRRLGASLHQRAALLARVNSGDVAVTPAPKPPGGMTSLEQLAGNISPGWIQKLAKYGLWVALAVLILLLIMISVIAAVGGAAAAAAVVVIIAAASAALFPIIKKLLQRAQEATELTMAGFTRQTIAEVPPSASFAVTAPGVPPPAASAGPDSAQASAFRRATTDLFTAVQSFPVDPPPSPSLETAALKTTLLARLDPVITVPRRVQALLSFAPRLVWQLPDLLEPIMAAPDFPQPMYAPLRDLNPDYVLPGVENVPPNTVGIVVSNHAFIESYMVGLNHEMARQLLWNDYPTDQRGSYFRQFWDVRAYVPHAGDPTDPAALTELLKDIPPVHTWPKPLPLGDHPNRTDIPLHNVVLLVRGELFKRYPNAIVYAGKAKMDGNNRVLDESDERYPIFRGVLPNDITFLGFNLSVDDARGGTAASPNGFFFVFQEQPSEPRFGLEPNSDGEVNDWATLAWTNFGGGGFTLPNLGNTTRGKVMAANPWRLASQVLSIVKANVQLPDFLSPGLAPSQVSVTGVDNNNHWGVNSAQTAYILLREPFRILIHADLMLPSSS